jgi:hypothetical protein
VRGVLDTSVFIALCTWPRRMRLHDVAVYTQDADFDDLEIDVVRV